MRYYRRAEAHDYVVRIALFIRSSGPGARKDPAARVREEFLRIPSSCFANEPEARVRQKEFRFENDFFTDTSRLNERTLGFVDLYPYAGTDLPR